MSSYDPQLARRYAKALFDKALSSNDIDGIAAQLAFIKEVVASNPKIIKLFTSPIVSSYALSQLVDTLAKEGELSKATENFLRVLVRNRRLGQIEGIIAAFFEFVAQHKEQVTATVISASKLSDKQKDALSKQLSSSLKKDVEVELKVDSSILGGLIVKIGSKMWDDSVAGKINRLHVQSKQAIATAA